MIKDLSDYKGKAFILAKQEEQIDTPFYKSIVTEIETTPDDFFTFQGKFMPNKGLTDSLARGLGIDFLPNVRMENVYGDEIVNTDGSKVRKLTGLRCYSQGKRMKIDGSYQTSNPVAYEFNWEDRAELDFMSNESKYNTPLKKRKHILELKKFATQRASTGSALGVIRFLMGTNTSLKKSDVEFGLIVVSQIVKSEDHQAALAKATIDNIRNGGLIADNLNNVAGLLTGNTPDIQDDFNNKFERPKNAPDITPEPEGYRKGHTSTFEFIQKPVEEVSKEEQEFSDLIVQISPERASHYLTETEKWKGTDSEIDSLKWAIDEIKGLLGK